MYFFCKDIFICLISLNKQEDICMRNEINVFYAVFSLSHCFFFGENMLNRAFFA